jgi:hypothetical protein
MRQMLTTIDPRLLSAMSTIGDRQQSVDCVEKVGSPKLLEN